MELLLNIPTHFHWSRLRSSNSGGDRFHTVGAYNFVRIWSGDEWKMVFSTASGHYKYNVMAYENRPSFFQLYMNDVFRDMLHRFMIVYIEDILIYSPSYPEHITHVTRVLRCLLEHGPYVKAKKCEFHKSVSFLEYRIGPDGVTMEGAKVAVVTEWPEPTTVKELQRFLGFANFCRQFIRGYSLVAAPLTN